MKKTVDVKPKSNLTPIKMLSPDMSVRYSEQIEMHSHLYKLTESEVIKFIGKGTDRHHLPDNEPELFLNMEHTHIFRTIDSDGNKHTKSVQMAGHYHLVEVEYDPKNPDAAPKIVAMSGPMHTVFKKVKGKTIAVDEPVNEYDTHIHDVEYRRSEKIQARVSNKEATMYLAKEASKTPAPPAGIGDAGSR